MLVRLYDRWLYGRRYRRIVAPVARNPKTRDALAELKVFLGVDCHTSCAGTIYDCDERQLNTLIDNGLAVAPEEEQFHFVELRRAIEESPYTSRRQSPLDGSGRISFSVSIGDAFVNRGLGVYPRRPGEPIVDEWGETDISKYDELSFLERFTFGDKAAGRQARTGKRNMRRLLQTFLTANDQAAESS